MKRLLGMSEDDLHEIALRATQQNVLLGSCGLPPKAAPPVGCLELEIEPGGETVLRIERGVCYSGEVSSIRRWLFEGELRFLSFDEFCRWIETDLRAAFTERGDQVFRHRSDQGCADTVDGESIPVVAREAEIGEALEVLLDDPVDCAVVLLGGSGTGKSTVMREIARRWNCQAAGTPSHRARAEALTSQIAPLAERLSLIESRLCSNEASARGALMTVEDLPMLCGLPVLRYRQSRPVLSWLPDPYSISVLAESIDTGSRLCSTASAEGWPVLKDSRLRSRIRVIELSEPSDDLLAKVILPRVAAHLAMQHRVMIAPQALPTVLRTSAGEGCQPGAAIRVLKRSVGRVKHRSVTVLGPDDVV